jgi:acyl carrier protein
MDQTVAALIAAHSGIPAGTRIAQDTDLYQAGMKSFAAVQLMLALEEAFGVRFPDEMLDRATFRSLGAIVTAMERLAASTSSAAPADPGVEPPGAPAPAAAATREPLLDRLVEAGLLISTGTPGVYGRSSEFEAVIAAFEALITRAGAEGRPEVLRFPPALPRSQLEATGFMANFPQLAGTVHAFCGDDHDHLALIAKIEAGEDWTTQQRATGVALTPAACYPLYPVIAARGPLPDAGRLFDVQSYCFRHEPSLDPARMQLFRMREFVQAGAPETVLAFREAWIERAGAIAESLQLPHRVSLANDPFFGRGGRVRISSQVEQALKFELLIPVAADQPTACFSFNYHLDHMARTWGLRLQDGSWAHSACVGFGLERTALALFAHHGLDLGRWPAQVRATLWD